MNRTNWEASSVEIKPVSLEDKTSKRMFHPKGLFKIQLPSKSGQMLTPSDLVHIPELMQPYFLKGTVRNFAIEVLPIGRLANRLLPGFPHALVCAIVTETGERLTAIPRPLQIARKALLGSAFTLAFASIWLLSISTAPALASLALAGSMLAFKAVADIPFR